MRIDESRTAVNYTAGRQGRKIVDLVKTWPGDSTSCVPGLQLIRLPQWCRTLRIPCVSRCASAEPPNGCLAYGRCAPQIYFRGLLHAGAARFQNVWPSADATAPHMRGSCRCDRLPSLPGSAQRATHMRPDVPSRDDRWRRVARSLSRCSYQSTRGIPLASSSGQLGLLRVWRSAVGRRPHSHASVRAGSALSSIQPSAQGGHIQGHHIHVSS